MSVGLLPLEQACNSVIGIVGHAGCGHANSHCGFIQDDSGGLCALLRILQKATGVDLTIDKVGVVTGVEGSFSVRTAAGGRVAALIRRQQAAQTGYTLCHGVILLFRRGIKKRLPHVKCERRRIAVPLSFFTQRGLSRKAGRGASTSPALPDALHRFRRRRACSLLTRPLCSLEILLLFPFNTLCSLYHSILAGIDKGVKGGPLDNTSFLWYKLPESNIPATG